MAKRRQPIGDLRHAIGVRGSGIRRLIAFCQAHAGRAALHQGADRNCKASRGQLSSRRTENRDRLAFVTSIDLEVSAIDGDHGVLGK